MTRTLTAILAQTPLEQRLQALRGGFNDRPTDPADVRSALLLIALPIICVLFIVLVWHFYARRKARPDAAANPLRLFDTVLRKLGVPLTDRFLLRAFARASNIQQPTALLFSRELFEKHARKWLDQLTIASLQRHARARFRAVADLTFGPAATVAMADEMELPHRMQTCEPREGHRLNAAGMINP